MCWASRSAQCENTYVWDSGPVSNLIVELSNSKPLLALHAIESFLKDEEFTEIHSCRKPVADRSKNQKAEKEMLYPEHSQELSTP